VGRLLPRRQRPCDRRHRRLARRQRVEAGARSIDRVSEPLRVAVIGSGPAGFYAAGALLAGGAHVDMIERLPTPWGLVRLGVAPDHPKIKSVSRAFEKIALQEGFRFLGNVGVGRDVQHDELLELYDAVLYAVGAQTDRRMDIPGEDLPGSRPATEFVAWYNGHPDFQHLEFDLSGKRAVVIGNGNVAVDVARMLALTTEELDPTDTTDAAIDAAELEGALPKDTNAERNLEVLCEYAQREPQGKPRRIVLRFFRSPVAILGDERVTGIELVRNVL